MAAAAGAVVAAIAASGFVAIDATAEPSGSALEPVYRAPAGDGPVAQPVLGFPGIGATIIGSSSRNGDGEVWAEADIDDVPATMPDGTRVSDSEVLVRRTDTSGDWQLVPVAGPDGSSLASGWTAAEATAGGAVVLAGGLRQRSGATTATSGILLRQPDDDSFAPVPDPTACTDLEPGEVLPTRSDQGTPVIAAGDLPNGTGVFVAPVDESATTPGILDYDSASTTWARERICASLAGGCTPPSTQVIVDAISVSSAANAWLIATAADEPQAAPQLYEREATADRQGAVWVQQPTAGQLPPELELPAARGSANLAPTITASGQGVWLDLAADTGAGSATVFYTGGSVTGTWCSSELTCPDETGALPATLPVGYGSVVTTPADGSSPGSRIITGLPSGAAMELEPGASSFTYETTIGGESESASGAVSPDDAGGNTFGPGGETVSSGLRDRTPGVVGGGAAFTSPSQGWIGVGGPTPGPEVAAWTTTPVDSSLRSWPLPAEHPLLAVAGAPGQDAAGGNAPSVAVGAGGQIERFTPSEGWATERPVGADGSVQSPTLRGVAWPTADDAYAVGDGGAMWRWQASTGAWAPDPGKPSGLQADLTSVAFSASDPSVGYAVGKNGALLSFSASDGSWRPQPAPPGLQSADFASVTFAAGEAIAAYRIPSSSGVETGGLVVDDGSGWEVDTSVATMLGAEGVTPAHTVLTAVAGLPDGGAVAAGPGVVVERDGPSSGWHVCPYPLGELSGGAVSALAAYTDSGGATRAVVAVDPDPAESPNAAGNVWQPADIASPPAPDPLPNQGFVVRETSQGWVDAEREDYPGVDEPAAGTPVDQPGWPDGAYALLVDSTGTSGWAVGGQTGGAQAQRPQYGSHDQPTAEAGQTGSAARLGSGPTPPVGTATPDDEPAPPGVTIAVGGGRGCNAPCADDAGQDLGPNADLAQAISQAGQIDGVGAFVSVGRGVGWSASRAGVGPDAFARELGQFSSVLSGGASRLPVYATPDGPPDSGIGGDIQAPADELAYARALGDHDPVAASTGPTPPPGTDAYAVDIQGSGDDGANVTLRLITLDFSQHNSAATQIEWLAQELAQAHDVHHQSIVIGADDITGRAADNDATDAAEVRQTLLAGGASAYVFNQLDGANTQRTITSKGNTLSVFGVGSLGYGATTDTSSLSTGFVLLNLSFSTEGRGPNGADLTFPTAEIPDAGEVSLDPPASTVPSGRTALFAALTRRVRGGNGGLGTRRPYFALPPKPCTGDGCLFAGPTYAFSSSDPSIGQFVDQSKDPDTPITTNGKFTADGLSPLFCAYAPGTTTVAISAGGVTYSEPITVTPGPSGGICDNPAEAPAYPSKGRPTKGSTTTVTRPAPQPPQPQPDPMPKPVAPGPRPPAPQPHPHPVPHHPAPAHHAAAHHPRAPAPVHHRSAPAPHPKPSAPAAVPPPRAAASVPVPKAPPSNPAPARPVPPPGASAGVSANVPGGVPSSVPGGVPVSSPSAVPGNVAAVQRRSSAEAAVEEARQGFAAYRPPRSGLGPVALGLLGFAVAGAGASGLVVRRRGRRVALAWVRGARVSEGRSR